MDLAEVAAQTMSKKSYMKKWRGLTDDEAQEELEQIALERQIIDDNVVMPRSGDRLPYSDATKDQMDQQAEEQQEQDVLEGAAEGMMDDITGGV